MRGPVLAVILVIGALAGCLGGASPKSPFYAPKLVVDYTQDDRVELFVSSAFREISYERIVIRVDNATVVDENHTRAAILKLNDTGFFADVNVHASDETVFVFAGRIEMADDNGRLLLSLLDEGGDGWREPREFSVPYEHILDREEAES